MIGRAVLGWLAILVLAIVNGAFRQGVLIPRIGERSAHLVSTLMLSLLVLLASWLLLPWIRPGTLREAWAIGGLWLVLTLAFEFLAGHFLFGDSWERLLAEYDITAGRIWILVLLCTLLGPVVAYWLAAPEGPGTP
jgi:hypothetical protein